MAHFLLVNKNAATYKRVLQMLSAECEKLGFSLSASLKDGSVMLVYEIAMINTFKSSFPSCKIKGCRLHIGQSLWCRIQRLGLAPLYRQKDSLDGEWLRGVFGLPLLPQIMIKKAFDEYCKAASSSKIKEFKEYISANYVSSKATFPSSMWMWTDLDGPSTNNSAESFHRQFGDLFGYFKGNPMIWHFLCNMRAFNTLKEINMNSKKIVKKCYF